MKKKSLLIGIFLSIIIVGARLAVFFILDPLSPIKIQWIHETDEGHYYSSPVIIGNRVYIGTGQLWSDENMQTIEQENYHLYCLDKNTGNEIWKYPVERSHIRCGPTIREDRIIYFIAEYKQLDGYRANQTLYALNSDGVLIWNYLITPDMPADNQGTTPSEQQGSFSFGANSIVLDNDGNVYANGYGMYSFNGLTGTLNWHNENVGFMHYGSVMIGNTYFTGNSSYYFAIDKLSGLIIKNKTTGQFGTMLYPSVDGDGNIITGTNGGKILKLSQNLEIIWSYGDFGLNKYGGSVSIYSNPAIDAENNIYFGTKNDDNSQIISLNTIGEELWKIDEEVSDVYCSPCLGDDGKIYLGSEGMGIYIIDKNSGNVDFFSRKKVKDDVIYSSPVIDNDGNLFIGDMWGNVYSFKIPATGMDSSAIWPCKGGNMIRTFYQNA